MTLLLTVVLIALVFEYINGFHDTANSIATVVSTKVLTPRQAIILAATFNLIGALAGTAVAKTISSGLVDAKFVTTSTVICALTGAIIWNLVTWWFGLPSSSSHALIGGLCGATFGSAHGQWGALIWSKAKEGVPWYKYDGLLYKVVLPMVVSPLMGFLVGLVLMSLLYLFLRNWKPKWVTTVFGKAQLCSAAYMGFSHGSNDAQKTMGIIALTLAAATGMGTFDHLPDWARFLYQPETSPAIYTAQTRLAELYLDGKGVPHDEAKAISLLERAANGKNTEAAARLGSLLLDRDQKVPALDWLRKAAKAGDPTAQTLLAGLLTEAGDVAGAASLRSAAATNVPANKFVFATPKLPGVPTNATERIPWLEAHATATGGYAQVLLGLAHAQGKGVPKDLERARELWTSAARLGIPEAHLNLGILMLQEGSDPARSALHFRSAAEAEGIKVWIKVVCALTMATGTAGGGWRIIRTMGQKMVKLQAVHGFAAETTAATVLMVAAQFGMPVSTTHAITTSIMGVGCAKRFSALNISVVKRILWAWVLTLPVTGGIGYGLMRIIQTFES